MHHSVQNHITCMVSNYLRLDVLLITLVIAVFAGCVIANLFKFSAPQFHYESKWMRLVLQCRMAFAYLSYLALFVLGVNYLSSMSCLRPRYNTLPVL